MNANGYDTWTLELMKAVPPTSTDSSVFYGSGVVCTCRGGGGGGGVVALQCFHIIQVV